MYGTYEIGSTIRTSYVMLIPSLMGEGKWYLPWDAYQKTQGLYNSLDQYQYIIICKEHIISRFEKQLKHPLKLKDTFFFHTKKDCPKKHKQKAKLRFGTINYRCQSLLGPYYICRYHGLIVPLQWTSLSNFPTTLRGERNTSNFP